MINLGQKFSPRINHGDANYPFGSIKDNTSPGANDGTPLAAVWGNDFEGFRQAAMTEAGITPSGLPDTAQDSQLLDAVKAVTSGALRSELSDYGEASLWLRTRIIAAESRFGGMVFGDSSLTAANKNSTAIQAALDYAESIGGAIVEIPCGLGYVYYNAAPVIPKDTTLFSRSLWLVKVGNHVNTSYSIDALVHTKKYTGDNCSRFGIKGIIFKGNARSAYGIYGDATDHSFIEDCFFINIDRGHRFADAWLCRWTNVTWNNQGYAPGYLGFEGIAGTSNSLVNCWSKNFARGYYLGQIHYSELSSCGVDAFSVFAYSGGQAVSLDGCGAEDGALVSGGYVFGSGARSVTYNSCECLNIAAAAGVATGDVSLFDFNGSTAVINSFRLPAFNTAGVFNTVKMQSGAGAFVNGGALPNNAYCTAKILDANSKLEVSVAGYHSVYTGIGDKTSPDYIFGTSDGYLNGFRKSSDNVAVGKSTVGGSATFTAENEAHENSYTAFSGASAVTVNLLSFTHAGSTSRSSIFLEVFLSGPSGLSKYKGFVEITNGSAGSVTLTNEYGAAYTISGSVVGGVLQFTLGTTYSKALVKVTVSQWASSGKDTFTWV